MSGKGHFIDNKASPNIDTLTELREKYIMPYS